VGGDRIAVLGPATQASRWRPSWRWPGTRCSLGAPRPRRGLEPIRHGREIRLEGAARTGRARLAGATTDPAEALAWSDTLLCSVPSFAHAPILRQILPFLRPGHLLALLPGNLGALALGRGLAAAGVAEAPSPSRTRRPTSAARRRRTRR
jgi:hypothetical protein